MFATTVLLKPSRRIACGCMLLLAIWAAAAAAQPQAQRQVRLIIPAGPGGGVDTVARTVGQALGASLGQPVVMDNRPGAGTMLASELAAKAAPDGSTLLMMTNSHTINASVHKALPYRPVEDFTQGLQERPAW